MRPSAADFAPELKIFETEVESAIQSFYAWQTVHAVAHKDKAVERLLNQAPSFWNTSLAALQASALVTLGRVFDPEPENHNVSRLLSIAHANLSLFSKVELAARKRGLSPNADEWLPEYLRTAYEPTNEDFRRLKRHVQVRRAIYEQIYRPLRHKVFAHRGVATRAEVRALFAKTNIRQLQQLLVFLGRLHEALWNLYFNGHRPTLRPARFSVSRMLEQPSPHIKFGGRIQERLVHETQSFLKAHSRDA